MTDEPSDRQIRVTREERPHPALRKLGRACIALARWQRQQEQHLDVEPDPPASPAGSTSTVEGQGGAE